VKAKPTTVARTPRATGKPTKKALLEAWVQKRDEISETLIAQLDKEVFENCLPEDLELVWSKRLNTTAGRARWKRIRVPGEDWRHEAKVELSTKVLDSEGLFVIVLCYVMY